MKFIKIITYMLAAVTFIFALYTFSGKDKAQRSDTSRIENIAR